MIKPTPSSGGASFSENITSLLRQALVPRVLRIAPLDCAEDNAAMFRLSEELGQLAVLLNELIKGPPPDDGSLHRRYADLATGWWRIWRKCLQPGTERPLDEMKKIFNFVESLREALGELGLEIIDHTSKEIPPGLALEVLGYQERPGLKRDRVLDTVRPTVYCHDKLIQVGRVYAETRPASE